jgi:hypothetical protein
VQVFILIVESFCCGLKLCHNAYFDVDSFEGLCPTKVVEARSIQTMLWFNPNKIVLSDIDELID